MRRRLTTLVVLAAVVTAAIVTAAVFVYESWAYRAHETTRVAARAARYARVLEPLVAADARGAATAFVDRLTDAGDGEVWIGLYDAGGRRVFSGRGDDGPTHRGEAADGAVFVDGGVGAWATIGPSDAGFGSLYLFTPPAPFSAHLASYGLAAAVASAAILIFGAALILRVRRDVIDPLSTLIGTTTRIVDGDDHSVRAPIGQPDEIGTLAQSFNHMLDIIEQSVAADREREQRFRRLASASSEGIVFSRSGRIEEVNDQAAAMLGCTPADLVGASIWDQFDPSARDQVAQRIANGFVGLIEATAVRHDGATFPIEARVHAPGTSGGPTVFVFHDVTEQRREGERRMALEVQLQQAWKLEAVGRLAGGIAHDFNNTLTVILGYAELAMGTPDLPPRARSGIEAIAKAGRQSAALTKQLLTFARQQAVEPRILDLNATIDSTIALVRRLIGEHIRLIWRPGAGVPPVSIDPNQVGQCLANLCVNARDAIRGSGDVTIETGIVTLPSTDPRFASCAETGMFAVLAVTDTGHGVPREIRDRIFEPFFTTKRQGEGTGLGLATVFGVARQAGGFVLLESQPGCGSTFFLLLPAVDGPAADPDPEPVPDTGVTAADASGDGRIVLMVEDEPAILELGRDVLRRHGYVVLAAASPLQAVEVARTFDGPIDLLLSDVVMPEMSGPELADVLTTVRPGLPCLFISGYEANSLDARPLGPDRALMHKPFSPRDLVVAVHAAIGRRGTPNGTGH